MIKIALDAMGGDYAPKEQVEGALKAVKLFKDIEVHLFGNENDIKKYLKPHPRVIIKHTDAEPISMGETNPISAVRTNKQSSMVLALNAAKSGECDACVSSGATQALIVGAHMYVRRMKGMKRTAIAPVLPTHNGGCILIDAGANITIKAEYMIQQTQYAIIYAQEVLGIPNPRVGLINIGDEEGKGRDIDKEVYELLKENNDINFIGNVEPKIILDPECDILLSDGWTSDIVMKCIEGTAKGMSKYMKMTLFKGIIGKLFAILMLRRIKKLKKSLDASEIGGALIYGLSAPVIKAQGASKSKGIMNAIRQARNIVNGKVVEKVKEIVDKDE